MESNKNLKNKALTAFSHLLDIVDELREKCPWDQKQTMESLRHLTIEETFELSEAILERKTEELKKELGDLLLHIVLYARIESDQHLFTFTEITQALCNKLIHRHPHIYGQEKVANAEEVKKNWEKYKLKEKEHPSVLGGVPQTLPSLIKALRIQEKVSMVGFDWESKKEVGEKIQEKIQALVHQHSQNLSDTQASEDKFGDVLFTLVHYATLCNVNAESSLERSNRKFIKSFQHVEQQVSKQGKQITQLSTRELRNYWEDAEQQAAST